MLESQMDWIQRPCSWLLECIVHLRPLHSSRPQAHARDGDAVQRVRLFTVVGPCTLPMPDFLH
jgi:hypothetical protein